MPKAEHAPEFDQDLAQEYFRGLERDLTPVQKEYLDFYIDTLSRREVEIDFDKQKYLDEDIDILSVQVHKLEIPKPLLEFKTMQVLCKTDEARLEHYMEFKDNNTLEGWSAYDLYMFAVYCKAENYR